MKFDNEYLNSIYVRTSFRRWYSIFNIFDFTLNERWIIYCPGNYILRQHHKSHNWMWLWNILEVFLIATIHIVCPETLISFVAVIWLFRYLHLLSPTPTAGAISRLTSISAAPRRRVLAISSLHLTSSFSYDLITRWYDCRLRGRR